jgi:hypothetical protein
MNSASHIMTQKLKGVDCLSSRLRRGEVRVRLGGGGGGGKRQLQRTAGGRRKEREFKVTGN